ncbi:MAG: phosphate/phosphite/phosphonate ABC transporter substrate-binding protein [bacterium]|nr:phosphate/phosphite/phosphonate ABC transporter substrate-binding protein [bacterium]
MHKPYSKLVEKKIILLSLVFVLLVSECAAYDGEIDAAYMGGAFLMEKSATEKVMMEQIWTAVLAASGLKKGPINLQNFVNEDELYKVMKEGKIIAAAVSHAFFKDHEKELDLEPLVVPVFNHNNYIRACLIMPKEGDTPGDPINLQGKKVGAIGYFNETYHMLLLPKKIHGKYIAEKYPDNYSLVSAVLYDKVDAALVFENYLNNLLILRPFIDKKIKTVMTTRKMVPPPLVYQKGRLTPEEKEKLIDTLLNAEKHGKLKVLLDLIGVTDFRRVTPEMIRRIMR